MMHAGEEFTIDTRHGTFAVLAWPNPGAPKLICLHGWLDNAASFIPLAPYLEHYDLIALDFAGHGHSAHRPRGARYYMVDNAWDLDAVLDALGWDQCNVMGHSLGGVVATLYSATAPGRVQKLITLDGLGPLTARPGETVARLRRSLESVRRSSRGLRDFSSIDEAALARSKVSGLPGELARLIVSRALSRTNGVYRWHTDPALNWHSPSLLTEAQVLEILAAIEAPVLAIVAEPLSRFVSEDMIAGRSRAVPNMQQAQIEGHHHFHMDKARETAALVCQFLDNEEARRT
ncbi:MAG: alpha/beta hydrolase [Xanthomonadales bacterium]|nr:alpha/beta fold hydrolase [Gammaproteobacteria bacterium]NNE05705.1 alpha/beta hydrolase [Xanthomonadales bacterium]NNL95458.1 alpha/beta hydrolase [Xanthomonadales bacterium]